MFMQADDPQPLSFFKNPGSSAGEVLLLVGIFVGVALVIFLWAAYARRPCKMHHVYSHLHQSDDHGKSSRRRKRSGSSRLFGRKHRRRRSHEKERPINPTLAQTGGLPPRHEEQRPPS